MTNQEDRPTVTDHTTVTDLPHLRDTHGWRRHRFDSCPHATQDQYRECEALMDARTEATLIVRGGLLYDDAEHVDQDVRLVARGLGPTTLDRAEAARLAVALIRGYVTTHPVADAAELDYVADLRALRRLQASRRRLRRIVWAARDLNRHALAASHALVAFAHPVHNPVENSTGVVL